MPGKSSRRNPYAKVGADRAEMMRKSTTRAGGSKADRAVRQARNQGTKDGEIRIGKAGKTYNVYDAKSGTWKRGIVKSQGKPPARAAKRNAAPRSAGSRKEAGLVNRPTSQNPSYGAGYIVAPGTNQRSGNVINNPSRRRATGPRRGMVPKKTR